MPRRGKLQVYFFWGARLFVKNIEIIQFTMSIRTATVVHYKNFCRSIIVFPNLIDFTIKNLGSFPFELIFVSQVFA